MVDICLELPASVIELFESRAEALGTTAENLMREAIEAGVPPSVQGAGKPLPPLEDEPIVQAAEIEKECRRLGYPHGWRFITCPQNNAQRAKLLLVTLNPAGRAKHVPAWSQEMGSAYRVESWNGLPAGAANLQLQVQRLFTFLGLYDDEVFSAHYVPFRSPSWAELDHKAEAEVFAGRLWRWLQPKLSFERVVCIGKDRPGKAIASLFSAELEASLPVGWGEIKADRYRLPDGRQMVALPHLSRFGIFGREAGEPALKELFEC